MELSDLTAYAEEKYHIKEEFKWNDFPGFSVLREPVSGKWVALLMRQWDSDSGVQIELCDIKCGEEAILDAQFTSYLSSPFRMRGEKWAGIRFANHTNAEVVFRLFDRAMQQDTQLLFNFALGDEPTIVSPPFTETPLPNPATLPQLAGRMVPAKILEMKRILKYERSNAFSLKCKRFFLQGKFMEAYEDNLPWDKEFWCFLPTYHDLNLKQLRGYFTWRTKLRHGDFRRASTPYVYIYFYELLNGIGVSSPEEALRKMEEFKTDYMDSKLGNAMLQKSFFQRWMMEFSVINNLPVENALKYCPPDKLASDLGLGILRKPEAFPDEEVVKSLLAFVPQSIANSPLLNGTNERGIHLVAESWRLALSQFSEGGKDLFTLCFGQPQTHSWYPLTNAVYWERRKQNEADYALNDNRHFHCHNGIWQETCFSPASVDSNRIRAFLHETDRQLRKYLKTGHPLREKAGEEWGSPFVEAAIKADKLAKYQAKTAITIDLSGLDQIRKDALHTQNSLLTEEERQEEEAPIEPAPLVRAARALCVEAPCNAASAPPQEPTPPSAPPADLTASSFRARVPLDGVQTAILQLLLQGESAKELLKAHHQMASVVADAINEALYDEIGDNMLECDGDDISIVEDYREDITRILGGNTK